MVGICLCVHMQNGESVPEQWHRLFCKHGQWVPWVARKHCIKYFFPSLLGSTNCHFFFFLMAGDIYGGKKVEDKKGSPHALKGNYVKTDDLVYLPPFLCLIWLQSKEI